MSPGVWVGLQIEWISGCCAYINLLIIFSLLIVIMQIVWAIPEGGKKAKFILIKKTI